MQRHAPGSATVAPSRSFVTTRIGLANDYGRELEKRHTNIAPDWDVDVNITCPYECVNTVNNVAANQP